MTPPVTETPWYLFIHSLPPTPLYLRAKIRRRLAKIGAVALKDSVYVLPATAESLEDLQWIAQEAEVGGGDAYICRGDFAGGISRASLVTRFNAERDSAYKALAADIRRAVGGKRPDRLQRFKRRFDEIAAIDFFKASGRREVDSALNTLERRLPGRRPAGEPARPRTKPDLVGRTWVTRKDLYVDRLASAWLIRRFIDPKARFRVIDPGRDARRPGEILFDIVGGDFSHEGDRCTFESMLRRLGVSDPALARIAEIVHDIDLKDGKYGRPDVDGIRRLLVGLTAAHSGDEERLERGLALFDDLYASFRVRGPTASRGPTGGRRRRTRRLSRTD